MKSNNEIEICNCSIIHQDIINDVRKTLPDEDTLYNMAEFFKIFGDYTRIKILFALSSSEMCVCDLSSLLGMSQSAISHQLRVLKQTRLVKYRRDGKVIYYSLDDEHIKQIFDLSLIHVTHN